MDLHPWLSRMYVHYGIVLPCRLEVAERVLGKIPLGGFVYYYCYTMSVFLMKLA